MIVSHDHRFIFIKTRKTAGTSVELFLSPFCGDQDVLTTLGNDEALREGPGARNFWVDGQGRRSRPIRMLAKMIGRPAMAYRGYYPHMPASEIRRLIGEKIWRDYYKFTIERNPWDRQVSLYHWHYRNRGRKPSFDRFIRSPFHRKISPNFDTYAIDGAIAADYVCRYERLADDLNAVLKQVGIETEVALPWAKAGHRRERAWRDYYTPHTRDIVGRWYAREIDALGYSFEERDRS
jgi:hypothetical protein